MSQKITKNNLSYDSSIPPFLAKLRAEAGGHTGPDPLLGAQKRSVKKRSSSEEAEDAPLVVDEQGNAVDFQVGNDGTVKAGEEDKSEADESVAEAAEKKDDDSSKTTFGARKRKVGKVIGNSAETPETDGKKTDEESKGTNVTDKKVKKKSRQLIRITWFDRNK